MCLNCTSGSVASECPEGCDTCDASNPTPSLSELFSDNVKEQIAAAKLFKPGAGTVPRYGGRATKDIVHRLLDLMKSDNASLHRASFDALATLATQSDLYPQIILEANGIEEIIKEFDSEDACSREMALWSLGCFMKHGIQYRDSVISRGVLEHLPKLLADSETLAIRRAAGLLLEAASEFSMYPPDWKAYKPLLQPMRDLLENTEDEDIMSSVCCCYASVSGGPPEHVEDIVESGVIPGMMEVLKKHGPPTRGYCLRTVGIFIYQDSKHAQPMLDLGLYSILSSVLSSDDSRPSEIKSAIWILSNMFVGPASYISAAIDCGIFPLLIDRFGTRNAKSREETWWALSNAACCQSTPESHLEQIKYLTSVGAMRVLTLALSSAPSVMDVTLNGLSNMLECGKDPSPAGALNVYAMELESLGGMDLIAEMAETGTGSTLSWAYKIMQDNYEM